MTYFVKHNDILEEPGLRDWMRKWGLTGFCAVLTMAMVPSTAFAAPAESDLGAIGAAAAVPGANSSSAVAPLGAADSLSNLDSAKTQAEETPAEEEHAAIKAYEERKAEVEEAYKNVAISQVENYVNIRQDASTEAEVLGKIYNNAAATILETVEKEDGTWYKVKSGPIVGYISSDPQYTATGREAKDIALQTASLKAVISTDVLNVRTEPSTDAKIWTQIVKDEKYPVIDDPETPDGWLKIDLDSVDEEDGGVSDGAYISTRDNNVEVRYVINEAIKFKPAESGSGGSGSSGSGSRRSQIVNYAIQFVGNPYVWGGTSLTNGVDCSGFTMKVMQKFGVSLPHYSGSQAKMGKKVTSGNMKPGDLIFYAGSNGRINHVALYIGNGQVVHAASRRSGIKISTWNYRSPVAIRNMLD